MSRSEGNLAKFSFSAVGSLFSDSLPDRLPVEENTMSCPVRPEPLKNKASLFFTFFVKRNSWLSGLFERSYVMKTGRVKLPGIEIVIASELPLVKK
jgi:hypothetical protein